MTQTTFWGTGKNDIARLLRISWCPAMVSVVLFFGLAIWGPPETWAYTLLGFVFLVAFLPGAIYSLKLGATAFAYILFGALMFQGWLSAYALPISWEGGGAEFVMQLCISVGGVYLVLFAFRRQILRWLFGDDP